MLPQAQLWYLIKARLHHSAGKGSLVQERSCVYMCFQESDLRERADRQSVRRKTEVQVVRKWVKENVWAVSKMGTAV